MLIKIYSIRRYRKTYHVSRTEKNEISCCIWHYQQEKNVIIILSAITVMFIFCNFPQAVLRIMYNHAYNQNAPFQIFRLVCNLTEFLNASVNFLIYFLCNRQIRGEVKRLLSFRKSKSSATQKRPSYKKRRVGSRKQRAYDVIA